MKLFIFTACVLVGSLRAQGDEANLKTVYDAFWEWRLQNNPEFASNIGDHRNDSMLEDYGLDAFASRKEQLEAFKSDIAGINRANLSTSSKVFYDVLRDMVNTWLDGYRWRYYGPMNPISFLDGIQTSYSSRSGIIKFMREQDFNNFIIRIQQYAKQVDDVIKRMNKSIAQGTTHHNVSMSKVPGQLDVILKYKNNETFFAFYDAFKTTLDGVITNQTKRTDIRTRATQAIRNFITKIENLKEYIVTVYMANTRSAPGVHVLPQGGDYYKACLKWHLSMDIEPEKIHEDGKREVANVFAKMEKIVRDQQYQGTVREYFDELRNRQEFFIQDEEAILQRMRDILNQRIRPALAPYFEDPPEFPMEIKRMPYDGPNGIYKNGAADGSRPGVFYANVYKAEYNPTYSMPTLLMHETDPGHHLQDAYALTSDAIPDFMKSTDFSKYFAAPLHFPFYTSYSEGWALYCEDMGIDLNILKDDYERMGKYSLEIFRAARMVVDTGLHYKRWSKEKAVEYMLNYTTFARTSIEREIDRYVTWPGQATSYTVGKLKFLELKQKAVEMLGKCFNIKEFHRTVLIYGALPLSVMEQVVDDWIAKVKSEHTDEQCDTTGGSAALQSSILSVILVLLVPTLKN